VLNIVHGTHAAVNATLDHPDIAAISFVGSGGWAAGQSPSWMVNGRLSLSVPPMGRMPLRS
jgi:hypothetical protein